MTEIYLIRHAQAEGNLYRVMQGHWDGGVTRLGMQQISALAERFKNVYIDAVYSSDLYRTRMTASALLKYHKLPLQTDKRLREINIGPWETKFFVDMAELAPEQMAAFIHDPENWKLDGAETYGDVRARAYEALCEIAEANEKNRIVIVSHGVTLRCLISRIAGITLDNTAALPIFGNTAVSKILYENGAFTVDFLNDISHLAGLPCVAWNRTGDLRCEYINPTEEKTFYTDCYADAWLSAHGSLEGFEPEPYLTGAVKHFKEDKHSVMKLYDGAEPVGIVDLDPERGKSAGYGWISLLYLKKDYRGKGYGAQLMGRAIFHFRELGRRSLRLNVASDNAVALRFYEANGFEPLTHESTRLGKLILMERSLEAPKNV